MSQIHQLLAKPTIWMRPRLAPVKTKEREEQKVLKIHWKQKTKVHADAFTIGSHGLDKSQRYTSPVCSPPRPLTKMCRMSGWT